MLSLLSLQAELLDLRSDFYAICEDDEKQGEPFACSFAQLLQSRHAPNDFQYSKLVEIRAKLGQYCRHSVPLVQILIDLDTIDELLLQGAEVGKLNTPPRSSVLSLQQYLRDPKGGNNFLRGPEAFTWRDEYERDFVALYETGRDRDVFTKWLLSFPVKLYHRTWGHKNQNGRRKIIDEETGLVEYGEERLEKTAQIISTTLASTIPMLAILGLYYEKSLLNRLYIAIAITIVFSGVLSVFTNARRIEIFTATAGLAAVEVVFIGSTNIG